MLYSAAPKGDLESENVHVCVWPPLTKSRAPIFQVVWVLVSMPRPLSWQTCLPTTLEQMGNPPGQKQEGDRGGGVGFLRGRDIKGQGTLQLKGTLTPAPVHQRLVASCIFSLPGSKGHSDPFCPPIPIWQRSPHMTPTLWLQDCHPQTTAVAGSPTTSPSPLSGASHQDSLSTLTYFHTRPL